MKQLDMGILFEQCNEVALFAISHGFAGTIEWSLNIFIMAIGEWPITQLAWWPNFLAREHSVTRGYDQSNEA